MKRNTEDSEGHACHCDMFGLVWDSVGDSIVAAGIHLEGFDAEEDGTAGEQVKWVDDETDNGEPKGSIGGL